MEISKAAFYKITYEMTMAEHERFNIGTYKEKKLHKILKLCLEPDPSFHEIPCAGFIADIKKEDSIIEIETSGFTGLRDKLAAYLPEYHVTLVYPMAASRSISWIDPETGAITQKRRSPKKENVYDLLFECIYIADFLTHPNLTILGVCLEMEEYRFLDGWSRDKKKGSHRYERIPTDIYDTICLHGKESYAARIPGSCREDFTVSAFREAAKINDYTARAILKVLQKTGVIVQSDKKGRCLLYSRTDGISQENG